MCVCVCTSVRVSAQETWVRTLPVMLPAILHTRPKGIQRYNKKLANHSKNVTSRLKTKMLVRTQTNLRVSSSTRVDLVSSSPPRYIFVVYTYNVRERTCIRVCVFVCVCMYVRAGEVCVCVRARSRACVRARVAGHELCDLVRRANICAGVKFLVSGAREQ